MKCILLVFFSAFCDKVIHQQLATPLPMRNAGMLLLDFLTLLGSYYFLFEERTMFKKCDTHLPGPATVPPPLMYVTICMEDGVSPGVELSWPNPSNKTQAAALAALAAQSWLSELSAFVSIATSNCLFPYANDLTYCL
jgi:hypothetical protein